MGRGPSMKAVKGFKRTQARKAAEGDKRKTNAKLAQRKREKEDKMIAAVKILTTEKRQKVEPAPARSASKLAAEVPTGEKMEKISSQSFKKGGKKPGKGKRRILSSDEKHEMKMTGPIGAVLRHCEVFRRDDCEPAERERRIGEVLKTLRKEVDGLAAAAVKLNTARVLQSCIKHGTPAQQDSIIAELKEKLVDLSQNQAASHVLLSMYTNCKMTQLKALSRAFAEQTATLVKHRVGIRVLDAAFVNSNRTDQRAFVVYAVGRPDVVMESNKGEKTLEEVWEANPRSKTVSLQALFGRVDAAVSRGLVDYGIVHRLLDVYFTHGMQDQCVELAKQLIDKTVHFCNDQYGSKVALRALEYVGPEGRASLISTLSDSILPMSCGRHSYLLASRVVDVIDDTTLVRDQFLRELVRPEAGENNVPAIQELVTSVAGSKILLHLLTPNGDRKLKLLQPAHGSLLWSLRATPTSEINAQITVETRRPGAGAVSVENRTVSETAPGPRHDLALAFLLRPNSSAFQGSPTQDGVGLLDLAEGGDVALLMRDTQARRVLYELVNFSNTVPAGWTETQGVLKEAKKTLTKIDSAYKAVHSAMEEEGKKRKGEEAKTEAASKPEKTKEKAKEEAPEMQQKKAPTKKQKRA